MSLASVHTAAAIVVRALGDAGVSTDVALELDNDGIRIRPSRTCTTTAWVMAVNVVAELTDGNGSHRHCVGRIDGIGVTASWT